MKTKLSIIIFMALSSLTILANSIENGWVRKGGVLFGDQFNCQKPAVLDFNKVWNAIPEIIYIKRENPGPARRDILIATATGKFKRALKRIAFSEGYDCIVKKGYIIGTPPATPVDITNEMVNLVKKIK